MVFFYRRFLPLDVFIYAFGAENDASSTNLPIPFIKPKRLSQILHLRQPLLISLAIDEAAEHNHAFTIENGGLTGGKFLRCLKAESGSAIRINMR